MEDLRLTTFKKSNSSLKQFPKNRCLVFEEYFQQSSNHCLYFDSMEASSYSTSNTLSNDTPIKSIIKNSNRKQKERKKVTFKQKVDVLLVESFKEYQLQKGSFIDISLENQKEKEFAIINEYDEENTDNFQQSEINQHNIVHNQFKKEKKTNKHNQKLLSSNEISHHFQMKRTTIIDGNITWNKDVCKCIIF